MTSLYNGNSFRHQKVLQDRIAVFLTGGPGTQCSRSGDGQEGKSRCVSARVELMSQRKTSNLCGLWNK